MLFDFEFYNPTKIYFGKNAIDKLGNELNKYGPNILLVYGKTAIKKIGLYDKVVEILSSCNKNIVELPGIKPNPTYTQVLRGVELVRKNNIDLILAVGGGSVIDCAKAISVSAYCEDDPWQKYWVDFKEVDNKIIPVASILTMVGTGSEMNAGSVITNEETMIKEGRVFSPDVNPVFSILNPEYTYTVPKLQMVSGIYDIISHLCEQYFSGTDDNTSDYLLEAIMKSVINSTRVALNDHENYEARSNIMWSATVALNKMSGVSKEQDWMVHSIEHQIGAYTDCPHGVGLAIVSIPYYRHIYKYGLSKFVRFAKNVWNVSEDGKSDEEIALEGIDRLEDFIKEMGMPISLKEIGTTNKMLSKIANSVTPGGYYKRIERDEVLQILRECY